MTPAIRLNRPFLFAALLAALQTNAHALPKKNEVAPYGEGVVANGYARLQQQSTVHYTESYLDYPMDDTIRASYWSANQELIAFKKLEFNKSTGIAQSYEFVDYRRSKGYRVSVNTGVAKVETIRLTTDGRENITEVRSVDIDNKTVIDAGFHRFIVANWDRLIRGKTQRMNFLQVDRARLVPLKIKKYKCDTPNTTCYKVSLDNFLLQGVLPTLRLKYDTTTQTLLAYSGLGPVTKPNGKGQPVDIQYEYLAK